MNWFFIAVIAPFLRACSNFIDKLLISKYFKSWVGTLIIYSTLIGLPVAFIIALLNPHVLSIKTSTAICIILNSFLYISYLFPYFKALQKADVSVVVPIFQTIPVFSYFLALVLLGETLTTIQIWWSLLIILWAIGITLTLQDKKIHLPKDVFLLQLLASFIIAVHFLLFKYFAIQWDFWTVSFWQYIGFAIFWIVLLVFVKQYRQDFVMSFTKNSKALLWLNAFNEIVNIIAVIIFSFASLLAPLTLVWVINSFQPLFVFLIGMLLTLIAPHLIKENVNKKVLLQKIVFILLMFLGTFLLHKSL